MLLKDLFDFSPKSSRPASYGQKEGSFPFFTSSNVIDKYVDIPDYDGEFLIIGDGGTGNCKYYNGKFSASDHNYLLQPKNNTNAQLIRYFLMKDNYKVLNDGFKGVGIKNVSKTYIQNIDFNKKTNLSDDEMINTLSKIENVIDNLNFELNHLDELIKSRFIEMFGDVTTQIDNTVKLGSICKTIGGGTPTTKKPEYYEGNIPWITTISLGPNYIDGSDAKEYITQEAINNSATKLIPAGSIMVGTRVGVGKSSVNIVPICTNQDINSITNLDTQFNNLFIKHVVDAYQEHFDSIKKGATILGITSDDLRNINVPNVSLEAQKKYVSFVEQIDKSKFVDYSKYFL